MPKFAETPVGVTRRLCSLSVPDRGFVFRYVVAVGCDDDKNAVAWGGRARHAGPEPRGVVVVVAATRDRGAGVTRQSATLQRCSSYQWLLLNVP